MKQKKDPSFHSGQVSSTIRSLRSGHGSGQKTKKDSSLCSERVLQKLCTLEDLLRKKDDKPLTFKEACTYLGYSPSYLYKLTYRKIIPHYKPTGKVIFFSKNEIDEWVYTNAEGRGQRAELKAQDNSSTEGIKDPNQEDLFKRNLDEKRETENSSEGSAQEIVIEFPLKSRRKKSN